LGFVVQVHSPFLQQIRYVDDGCEMTPRQCTDVFFLLLKIAFCCTLIGLMVHCFAFGNVYRILNGIDECGDICGYRNQMKSKSRAINCSEVRINNRR